LRSTLPIVNLIAKMIVWVGKKLTITIMKLKNSKDKSHQ
jgi:hypothetical protein